MRMRRDKGSIEYSLCIMLLFICVLTMIYVMNMRIVTHTKINVDDAITGANLASAIIDLDEFKQSDEIYSYGYSDDTDYAYEHMFKIYKNALMANLGLDEKEGLLKPRNDTLIKSDVEIMEYYIYDVDGNDVVLKKVVENGGNPNYSWGSNDENGNRTDDIMANVVRIENGKGSVKTPDGTTIRTMTIYSKIKFDVESMLGKIQTVEKQHSVDVVENR